MKQEGVIINKKEHPDIYKWLSENVLSYKKEQKYYTLTSEGKINAYCDVYLKNHITEIKYPFGYVKGIFNCSDCKNLTSLIGAPEKVGEYFCCDDCSNLTSLIGLPKIIKNNIYFRGNQFFNKPSDKETYKLYLAMWLELLESVGNEERKEYITNYKDKVDYWTNKHIIPVEILKEYGF